MVVVIVVVIISGGGSGGTGGGGGCWLLIGCEPLAAAWLMFWVCVCVNELMEHRDLALKTKK